jgi:hypothetical protein
VRQSAAPTARKGHHGGTPLGESVLSPVGIASARPTPEESTEGVADDAKIAVFLLHRCGVGRVPGRAGGATFEGGLAADLLQVQRGEIFDSGFGCAEAEGALNLPFICFAF